MRRVVALAALLLALTLALANTSTLAAPAATPVPVGPARAAASGPVDDVLPCFEFEPDLASASQGLPGDPITLDVRVLLDEVDASLAVALVTKAAESYAPMNIRLNATYEGVSFEGTDTQVLLKQAKQHFGFFRPAGVDVVALLTRKDIEAGLAGKGVVGQADCIGGIELPDRAFMVAEARSEKPTRFASVNFFLYAQARVIAHEIGHLLGAHHHYSNCVEGVPSEALELEASPCTVMINDVGLASMNFSALNAAIVRGHAARFARP